MLRATALVLVSCGLLAGAVVAQQPPAGAQPARSPLDSISRLAGAGLERDTTPMLGESRLAGLPPRQRAAWQRYLSHSRELDRRNRASMAAELRAAGKSSMTTAPYVHYFTMEPHMTGSWFASDSARRLAANVLTWQTPAGGWSKHVDMRQRGRLPGESYYGESAEWHYMGTFDNDATVTQLRILGGVAAAWRGGNGESAARRADLVDAFARGLRYILAAQYPNGCWPQVYPLQGGYHDAVTFNDNVAVNVLRLLRDVGGGRYPFVGTADRRRARGAFHAGLQCVLRSQVLVKGERTVWGQQHDPLTLRPVPARSYELAGLCGRESAWLLDFLMELPPTPAVVTAVEGGAAWFRAHAIREYAYGPDQVLRPQAGAGPIWARNTEIPSMRPIFANRDGVKLYDWQRLTDRRSGYGWFGVEPAATLEKYESWVQKNGLKRQ